MVNKKDLEDLKTWLGEKIDEQKESIDSKLSVLSTTFDMAITENYWNETNTR